MGGYKVDSLLDYFEDFLPKMYKATIAKEHERNSHYPDLFNTSLPKFLKVVEGELAKHSNNWVCGDKLTVADFWIGGLYVNVFTNPNRPQNWGSEEFAKLMNDFPNYKAYGEKFAAEIKPRLDTRAAYPF